MAMQDCKTGCFHFSVKLDPFHSQHKRNSLMRQVEAPAPREEQPEDEVGFPLESYVILLFLLDLHARPTCRFRRFYTIVVMVFQEANGNQTLITCQVNDNS